MKRSSYKRILLKLSGEAFKGSREYGIDPHFLKFIAQELKEGAQLGVEIGIVIGGGNIFRGVSAASNGMNRVTADYSGMLATIMNALALQDALSQINVSSKVQTSIAMQQIAEPFILQKALSHFKKGSIVIFAGGTGNPYFTTDTTAALRAAEISADVILKATQVDGVYTDDPIRNPEATRYKSLNYLDLLNNQLKVMDSTAISLSMDNKTPIIVFDLSKKDNIKNIILGKTIGTLISTSQTPES